MSEKILFVDDEAPLLDSFRVMLRRRFDVYTALGPAQGLKALQGPESFAVIVSDLKMPSMDGITFLSRARELSPDSIRMMLTGFADVSVAMSAVNEGQVFRFLTKPCPQETITKALEAGLEQYRLVMAERQLLRGTLRGSVQLLTEALSLANPEAYGRANRIRTLCRRLAKAAEIPISWELDLAAMLSHIGCMALPRTVLDKIASGQDLTPDEQKLYDSHPTVGAGLLALIPRLEQVAEIIGHQHKRHDAGLGSAKLHQDKLHIARMLKIATDYDLLESRGVPLGEILQRMAADEGCYDPALLLALGQSLGQDPGYALRRVGVADLVDGMVLEEGIMSEQGLLLLSKGTEINASAIERMVKAAQSFAVVEPFAVRVPCPPGGC